LCHFLSALVGIFLFRVPPPPQIYPLSLHDALPIYSKSPPWPRPPALPAIGSASRSRRCWSPGECRWHRVPARWALAANGPATERDRKSTRLNSSHVKISYAVFCLKKKNTKTSEKAM